MDLKDKILGFLNKAYNDAKLYYIGLFIKGKVYVSKFTGSLSKLEPNFSKMIERSLEINEAIKNFNAEFLFAENKSKNFSIFVYYITNDIAIGILQTGKPNFSLLKVVATDLAKEIKPFESSLHEIYEKELKEIDESTKDDKYEVHKKELKTKKEPEKQQTVQESFADIQELEKALTMDVKSENLTQDIKVPDLFEVLKEDIQEKEKQQEGIKTETIPSLEDILAENETFEEPVKQESEMFDVEKVFLEMNTIFVKYIGPFGKFLFNKKKDEFFKTNSINKFSVLKFSHTLAEEIPEQKKREAFLEEIKESLLNI